MTTAPIDQERRRDIVARRVRELIAGQRLTSLAIARQLGMSSAAFSRRTTGELEFSFSEIETLAPILGVGEAYLAGYTDERSPRRSVPGGGSLFLPWESGTPSGTRTPNPLNKAASQLADVVELRPRPRSSATSTRGAVVVDLSSRRVS